MHNNQIAQNIKILCKDNDVSVTFLLSECGLGKGFVYDLEKRDKTPKIDTLVKIADFFGCSLDYLVGRNR